jgi:predicted RNA-binding protein with RPS1 domain
VSRVYKTSGSSSTYKKGAPKSLGRGVGVKKTGAEGKVFSAASRVSRSDKSQAGPVSSFMSKRRDGAERESGRPVRGSAGVSGGAFRSPLADRSERGSGVGSARGGYAGEQKRGFFRGGKKVSDGRPVFSGGFLGKKPEVGSHYNGTVMKVVNFGAFIKFFGSQEGLVHISEIRHSHVADMQGVLEVGQGVRVRFLGLDDRGKVRLSIKQALGEGSVEGSGGASVRPFEGSRERRSQGPAFQRRSPDFVREGRPGFKEEGSREYKPRSSSFASASGADVRADHKKRSGVYGSSEGVYRSRDRTPGSRGFDGAITRNNRRPKEESGIRPEVGTVHDATVVNILSFGAFVKFFDGREGLVHISEIRDGRVENVSDELNERQSVRVKVVGFDDRGKVRLSIKQALAS